ncbi:YkvA family protein [Methanolobus psychrotolerans]|uniref:YkvA family protein n=1 Tax=Methanolobus psychrotolerans TaxID=1874706 RepID=UPI001A9142B2|nr:YkvA family protein [Methanolobus psychrotolerans]
MGIIKMVLKASLKKKFYKVQLLTKTLSMASKRPDLPLYTRVLAGGLAIYALSPIDLIPDFIPILGSIDDIILVPLGFILVMKMIPEPIMKECRHGAEQELANKKLPTSA